MKPVVVYKKAQAEWSKEELINKFKSQDMNGDGKLSKNEIKKVFKDLGSSSGFYRANRAMHRADSDHNGYVDINDRKELEDLVEYAYQIGYKVKAY
uniref:EF-hand domain-containing protein n=1 Tax=Cannabis sativa TaxID=3483 RepID=A0A803QFJ6_CANSA